jgi:predicted DNA-binding ArsR family transcriptional regulator
MTLRCRNSLVNEATEIVQIVELFHRASKEKQKLTNADLGRWLFADENDPKGGSSSPDKAVHRAIEILREALAAIPALGAQVSTGPKDRERSN